MDGEADISSPCSSLNGCGWYRDTQSIAFFSAPGMEALYSGAQTTKPSQAVRRARNRSAPGGKPALSCTSAL